MSASAARCARVDLAARAHRLLAIAFVLACGAASAAPEPVAGKSFTNKDWSVDCDNTGTCRASGYQPEPDEAAVSVLIARAAGPGASVEAKVQFGSYGEGTAGPAGPVRLSIGGRAAGTVTDGARLTDAQVQALLKALLGTGDVVFAAGPRHWHLSGEGAASVLLKMDDLQGRVGTPGALARKGDKPEAAVPVPVRPPVIQAVRVAPSNPGDVALARRVLATVARKDKDDCDELANADTKGAADGDAPELWRLGDGRVLVAALCWRGAYNAGNGYWIARDKPPYDAKLVTVQADTFTPETGELSGAMKGRGLGDCWSSSSWVWDGHDFVHAAEASTGQCRLVAPGGAWDLPTLVSEVRKPR